VWFLDCVSNTGDSFKILWHWFPVLHWQHTKTS